MRILVISDIHGNLVALDAVLADAGKVDAVWCLGDIVGYGPDPDGCVERVAVQPNLLCIMGNHDAAAVGKLDVITFNPEARYSIEWTRSQMKPSSLAFLDNQALILEVGRVTITHGSPRSPVFEYLLDTYLATVNFQHFKTDVCFVGHTHIPSQFVLDPGEEYARLVFPVDEAPKILESRSIINPGSVGQPRDRDPRAAYAIFDPTAHIWQHRRVAYDIARVQERMRKARLPERHVVRLAEGW